MSFFKRKKTEDKQVEKVDADKNKAQPEIKATAINQAKKEVKATKSQPTSQSKEETKPPAEKRLGNAYKVLLKPLVTEKASVLGVENKYFFAVDVKANKIEIAKAINEVYGIKPLAVNIINFQGKKVRHGKTLGKRKSWKKAIITLPAGKSIQIYEGV